MKNGGILAVDKSEIMGIIDVWGLVEKHLDLLITSILSGAGTWIIGSKIRKAKGNMAEADVNSKIQLIYDKFVGDMDQQYTVMRLQIVDLRTQIGKLNGEIKALELQVAGWRSKYEELKRDSNNNPVVDDDEDHIISDGSEDSK